MLSSPLSVIAAERTFRRRATFQDGRSVAFRGSDALRTFQGDRDRDRIKISVPLIPSAEGFAEFASEEHVILGDFDGNYENHVAADGSAEDGKRFVLSALIPQADETRKSIQAGDPNALVDR